MVPNKAGLKDPALMEAKPDLEIIWFDYTHPVASVSLVQGILDAPRNISKADTLCETINQCLLRLMDLSLAEFVLIVAIYHNVISTEFTRKLELPILAHLYPTALLWWLDDLVWQSI